MIGFFPYLWIFGYKNIHIRIQYGGIQNGGHTQNNFNMAEFSMSDLLSTTIFLKFKHGKIQYRGLLSLEFQSLNFSH